MRRRIHMPGVAVAAAVALGLLLVPGCKKTAQVRDTTPTLPEELDPMLVRFSDFPVDESRAGRRPLVVFAISEDDPVARDQIGAARGAREGFAEREITLIEVYETGISRYGGRPMSPESAVAWHRRYRASKWPAEVVLVGKDGGVKRRAARAMAPNELFGLIDAMPDRRHEMYKRSRSGGGG